MQRTKMNFLVLMVLLSSLSWSFGKKYATVLVDVALIEDPDSAKPKYVQDSLLKRGEFVIIKDTKDIKGKSYALVQIDGVETKGWLEQRWIHEEKLESYTVLQDSDLYSRPNLKSPKSGRVLAGQTAFVFEEKDNFALIQYPAAQAYIEMANLAKSKGSENKIIRSVNFTDMGKATVNSSSQYQGGAGKETEFDVRNLFDGNLQTAWCEGKTGEDGIGEFVTVTFPEWVTLKKISIVSGWTKSEEIYNMNNRPSKIRVVGNGEVTIELQNDNYDYQTLADQNLSGQSFKFIIDGVHKGRDSDTCISEIKLEGVRGGEFKSEYDSKTIKSSLASGSEFLAYAEEFIKKSSYSTPEEFNKSKASWFFIKSTIIAALMQLTHESIQASKCENPWCFQYALLNWNQNDVMSINAAVRSFTGKSLIRKVEALHEKNFMVFYNPEGIRAFFDKIYSFRSKGFLGWTQESFYKQFGKSWLRDRINLTRIYLKKSREMTSLTNNYNLKAHEDPDFNGTAETQNISKALGCRYWDSHYNEVPGMDCDERWLGMLVRRRIDGTLPVILEILNQVIKDFDPDQYDPASLTI